MPITFGNITIDGKKVFDPNDHLEQFAVSEGSIITIDGVAWKMVGGKFVVENKDDE